MNVLEARRRMLGAGVYKKTVTGNPAIAQGSLARRYLGITMQGWTEQAQYEGKNLFDISDFETNNKGIIENGTILFKQSLGTVTYYLRLSPGTYSISIKRSGYSVIGIKVNEVFVVNNGGSNNLTSNFDVSDGDSVVLEFSEGQNLNGEDRMIYDIMLNSGSTALSYEPYTGGAPSPSPDYPQEIVSAGKYNEDTQKWEYEITIANEQTDPDKNQTVTLTSDRPLTKWDRLEKRNGQWGWVFKSNETVLDGSEQNVEGFVLRNETVAVYYVEILEKQKGSDNVIIDKMRYEYGAWSGTTGEYTFSGHPVSKLVYLVIPVSEEGEGIKSWFTSNPLVLWYETAEETFVPISASEQEQMNELYTFRPTTVLSNDAGCDMSLTYKTKKSLEVTT